MVEIGIFGGVLEGDGVNIYRRHFADAELVHRDRKDSRTRAYIQCAIGGAACENPFNRGQRSPRRAMMARAEGAAWLNRDSNTIGIALSAPWRNDQQAVANPERREPPLPHRGPSWILDNARGGRRAVHHHASIFEHQG